MTDEELKELIASFAVDRKEADRQLKERSEKFDQEMRERDEKFEREKQEWRSRMEEDRRLMRERDERFEREIQKSREANDKDARETRRLVRSISRQYGNSENNKGSVNEAFFYRAFSKNMKIGNIKFDFILPNKKLMRGQETLLEIDVMLFNTAYCAFIEVKYKCHLNDIEKLYKKHKKIIALLIRLHLPHEKFIFAIAAQQFDSECEERAYKYGFALAHPDGQKINVDATHVKEYRGI